MGPELREAELEGAGDPDDPEGVDPCLPPPDGDEDHDCDWVGDEQDERGQPEVVLRDLHVEVQGRWRSRVADVRRPAAEPPLQVDCRRVERTEQDDGGDHRRRNKPRAKRAAQPSHAAEEGEQARHVGHQGRRKGLIRFPSRPAEEVEPPDQAVRETIETAIDEISARILDFGNFLYRLGSASKMKEAACLSNAHHLGIKPPCSSKPCCSRPSRP